MFQILIPNETPGERILTELQPKKTKLLCCFRDKAKQYYVKKLFQLMLFKNVLILNLSSQ